MVIKGAIMVIDRIITLLAEQLNVDKSTLNKDTRIIEDLHADSLDVVEMLIALEDEFQISVPDEDAKDLTTIGKLAEYVETKTQQ